MNRRKFMKAFGIGIPALIGGCYLKKANAEPVFSEGGADNKLPGVYEVEMTATQMDKPKVIITSTPNGGGYWYEFDDSNTKPFINTMIKWENV